MPATSRWCPTQLHRLLDDGRHGRAAPASTRCCSAAARSTRAAGPRPRTRACAWSRRTARARPAAAASTTAYPLDGVAVGSAPTAGSGSAGPMLFDGYDGDPALTAEVLVDGWFVTSDVGRLDEDGRLQVLGRVDDVVISGGVNVPTPAVAARLREHPEVARRRGGRRADDGVGPAAWSPSSVGRPRPRRGPRLGRRGAPARLGAARRGRSSTRCRCCANGKVDRLRLRALAGSTDGPGRRWKGLVAIPLRTRFRGITVREGVLLRGARAGGSGARSWSTTPRGRRALAALRRGGRRRRLAGAGARRRPGQRHRARGRPRAGRTRSCCARRLPHRQGQGRRARPDPGRRPGPGRGGPRRARARRPDPRRRQRRLGRRRGGRARSALLDRAAGGLEYVEQPCASVEELAAVRRRGRRADRGRRVDPPRRRPLPGARPGGRRHRGAQGAAARRGAGLPADRRGHRAAGRGLERPGDLASASPPGWRSPPRCPSCRTPAGSRPCSCSPTTWSPTRCCRWTALLPVGLPGGRRGRPDPARRGTRPGRALGGPARRRRSARAAAGSPVMTPRTPSTALARAVVDALVERGVREVVLAPGSRNAPLAFAAYDAAAGRPAPAAHPHRRAHRRLPRPRA